MFVKKSQPSEKSRIGLYFMLIMFISYIILFFINNNLFYKSLNFFWKIIQNIWWVFILIFFLMVFTNYFFTNRIILKYLSKGSGKKSWFLVIIFGILSHGPIYMWYPLLAELQEKGMRPALIACFLYNRAIKIPLFPLMIIYFSLKYALVLLIVMIFISIINGTILEKIVESN